ncbi:hypothetical protein ACFL24_00200 [Patescibacteria group bacterium]
MERTVDTTVHSQNLRVISKLENDKESLIYQDELNSQKLVLSSDFREYLVRLIDGDCIEQALSLVFGVGKDVGRDKLNKIAKKMFDCLVRKDKRFLRSLVDCCYYIKAKGDSAAIGDIPVLIKVKQGLYLALDSFCHNTDILIALIGLDYSDVEDEKQKKPRI